MVLLLLSVLTHPELLKFEIKLSIGRITIGYILQN